MSLATIYGRRWSLQVQRALIWMATAVMGLQWGLTTQAMEVIWRVAIDERPVWELAGLDGPPPEWNVPALRPGLAMSSGDDSRRMTMTKKLMTTRMTNQSEFE